MAKIGTAHIEIKPVLNERALQEISEAMGKSIDGALCVTSAALLVSAARLHDAIWRRPDLAASLPDDVVGAYGDLQEALKRLGLY